MINGIGHKWCAHQEKSQQTVTLIDRMKFACARSTTTPTVSHTFQYVSIFFSEVPHTNVRMAHKWRDRIFYTQIDEHKSESSLCPPRKLKSYYSIWMKNCVNIRLDGERVWAHFEVLDFVLCFPYSLLLRLLSLSSIPHSFSLARSAYATASFTPSLYTFHNSSSLADFIFVLWCICTACVYMLFLVHRHLFDL